MKINYTLYNEPCPDYTPLQQVLFNRGIPVEKQEAWLNAGWDDVNDWRLLDNMEEAAAVVHDTIFCMGNTLIIQDPDADGYTSSSIIYNYLYDIAPQFVEECVRMIGHSGKRHGLSDLMNKVKEIDADVTDGLSLILIPDASSNDAEQCQELAEEYGIQIVILDHHESDIENPYATIVNPQMCDYPNKNLVGAGVTWQFCRAYDELYGYESANKFLDLCAVGQIGDMSDYREPEVRALVKLGLDNLRNKFVKAFLKKNDYTVQNRNGLNYFSLAFALVPFINGMTRSGTEEQKEIVTKAFMDNRCEELIESNKRGAFGVQVPMYEEAILMCERAKRKQTQDQDEAMEYFEKQIAENNLTQNAMLFLIDKDDVVRPEIKGLIANKVQAKYQHPVAVISDNGDFEYTGSLRNYTLSVNKELKSTIESTGLASCAGHENAAGLFIPMENLEALNAAMNEIYKDIDQTPTYHVDYIWNGSMNVDKDAIYEIADFNIYGQNIPESEVVVEDIDLSQCSVSLLGKTKKNTVSVALPNGVECMFFRVDSEFGMDAQDLFDQFQEDNMMLTVVGTCKKNEYNGNVKPQIVVEDYELREEWIF